MKPTPEQLNGAAEELRAIPYFPNANGAVVAIATAMGKFVGDPVKLRWLIDTAVGAMREWKGVAELRGLYCTRFKPADGIEETCTISGFTPDDSETQYVRAATEPLRIAGGPPKQISGEIAALAKRKAIR